MKNEIDKDFYCSAGIWDTHIGDCPPNCVTKTSFETGDCNGCVCYHRKHPTPEQYKEEYGEEYPNDGAVYAEAYYPSKEKQYGYSVFEYKEAKGLAVAGTEIIIVCACTPFGKPDKDWRPT